MISQSKVDGIILRFETTPDLSLPELIQMRRELSSQLYWYTKLQAQGLQQYRQARVTRKATYAKLVAKYKQGGNSIASANAATENDEEYREVYEAEYSAAGSKDAGYRLCAAIEQVLDAMKQEIADLRDEKKEQSRAQSPNQM